MKTNSHLVLSCVHFHIIIDVANILKCKHPSFSAATAFLHFSYIIPFITRVLSRRDMTRA